MTRARIHAVTIVLACLLLLPLAALPPGAAAQGYLWFFDTHNRELIVSRGAPHHFAMHARLELDVLADGTLAVRQVRGTATLQTRDAGEHQVWRVESATVSGFVILPDDRGAVVPVLEEIAFTLAPLHRAPPRGGDADRATVVVVVGPAEPPASDNGRWVAKATFTLSSDDTTLSGSGKVYLVSTQGGSEPPG